MKEEIWQEIVTADHGGKLSGYLSAFDQSIGRYQLDPCSELAMHIYGELIKKYRDGSLEDRRPQHINMFSFGKQNIFNDPKGADKMAKRLKYDED